MRSYDNWRTPYLASLEKLYRDHYKWAEGLCAILLIWDAKFDNIFKNDNRWQFFLNTECEKSALDYQVSPVHRNIFKELEIDFTDIRNPIGSVLVQFCQRYAEVYYDHARDVISQHDLEQASQLLHKIAREILGMVDIFLNAAINFYECIHKILRKREADLKGTILSQIICGELYRIVYDLAFMINEGHTETIQSVCAGIENTDLDSKLLSVIRQISISENPYEKLQYLYIAKELAWKKKQNDDIDRYVWKHIAESKVRDIFAHLYLIDIFSVEPIQSTVDFFLFSLTRVCKTQ